MRNQVTSLQVQAIRAVMADLAQQFVVYQQFEGAFQKALFGAVGTLDESKAQALDRFRPGLQFPVGGADADRLFLPWQLRDVVRRQRQALDVYRNDISVRVQCVVHTRWAERLAGLDIQARVRVVNDACPVQVNVGDLERAWADVQISLDAYLGEVSRVPGFYESLWPAESEPWPEDKSIDAPRGF